MKITVLFFSLFREWTGTGERSLELPAAEATVGDALVILFGEYPELKSWKEKVLLAVNCEYADAETSLRDGDEMALMPPVQGG